MDNIVSRFYLIKLDGSPVYVGYTNRLIKDRFREHLKDKDFGSGDVTLEGLGELSYTFTWDMALINQYAKEVSDRESKLIYQYGTRDSQWQKGVGDSLGGQTWSNIKYFVKTNRDNPKFSGMHEGEILEYLDRSYRVSRYMGNFVKRMDDLVAIYMRNFVVSMDDPVAIYMGSFVAHMNDPVAIYMGHFVSTMDDPVSIYMKSFVSHMDDPVSIYMRNFVVTMKDPVYIYVGSFVSNMDDPVSIYMRNLIAHMEKPVDIYI